MENPVSRTLCWFVAAMTLALCAPHAAAQTDCNANGLPDNEEVGWQLQSVLVATDGEVDDKLGDPVATHGDLVVVGVRRDDSNGEDSGSAYVYRRTGGTWAQEAKLVGSDTVERDGFGSAVAVYDGTIVIGVSSRSDVIPYSGAAYVFEHDGVSWQERAKLLPPGLQARDNVGFSVAIDGDYIVLGSPGVTLGCVPFGQAGAAHVFRREAEGWVFLETLRASDVDLHDEFGRDVAIAGDTIVVGAHHEGNTGPGGSWTDGSGAVYVFEWDGASWQETAKLRASNPQTFGFGVSVAATAGLVAVGAPGDDFGTNSLAGAVYLFEREASGWRETTRLMASDAEVARLIGGDIAIHNDTVVSSASVENPPGVSSMAAYVFRRSPLGWVQEAKIFGSEVVPNGSKSGGVALSDETLVLGDTKDNTNGRNAGAARVYRGFRNDCNSNGIPDECDITGQSSADCDEDGQPDECQPDCNMNGVADTCDVESLQSSDCDGDGVPDECEGDCNANGVPDPCDLLAGTSLDCQADGISDDCQLTGEFQVYSNRLVPIHARHSQVFEIINPPLAIGDVTMAFTARAKVSSPLEFITVTVNGTNVGNVFVRDVNDCGENTDALLVSAATFNSAVAGGNATIRMIANPEVSFGVCDRTHIKIVLAYSTQNDCNENGVPDECDIAGGASTDCQPNGIPDDCEADCNANGVADTCEVSSGTAADCQPNGILDACDIAQGLSEDCTANGVPDECDRDCNDNGLADVCEVLADPTKDCDSNGILDECVPGQVTRKLVANRPWPDDSFGDALAMQGDVLVVGSGEADSSWQSAGAVHIYRFDGEGWQFEQRLLPVETKVGYHFGQAVAVSGDTIFVGAVGASIGATGSGVVYVYRHTGDAWEEASKLVPCFGEDSDYFGFEIAVDANVMVISAWLGAGSGESRGAAYVYEYVAGEWTETARLVSPTGRDDEHFAWDVAVAGGTVAIGATNSTDNDQGGAVYLFSKIGGSWESIGQLDPPAGDDVPGFGRAVAMDNTTAIVGAYGDDSMGETAWVAYVFRHDGTDWTFSGKLVPTPEFPDPHFGTSVAVADSDRVIVASTRVATGDGECMANVYDYTNSSWTLSAQHVGSAAPAPISYRCAVAVSGRIVALGDTRDDSAGESTGAVFLFTDYENDCNFNGVPDECEPDEDCNGNLVRDICEIAASAVPDCNGNSVPDSCDLLAGSSPDTDGNGVPDECDFEVPLIPTAPHDIRKNRFVSVDPNNTNAVSFRVELLDLSCSSTGKKCSGSADCKACVGGGNHGTGCAISSDCPSGACTLSGESCDQQSPPVLLGWLSDPVEAGGDALPGTFTSDVVEAQPPARIWTESVVHIGACEIAPVRTYAISATRDGTVFSDPLVLGTIEKPQGKFWGDVVGGFNGVVWSAPNGLVGVDDVNALIKFLIRKPAPHITVVDLVGSAPSYVNFDVNATDLQMVLEAFGGKTFPPLSITGAGYPADGDVTQCP